MKETFLFLLCHIIRLIVLGQWKSHVRFSNHIIRLHRTYVLSIVSHIYDPTVNVRQVGEMRMKMPETSKSHLLYKWFFVCERFYSVYLNCSPSIKDMFLGLFLLSSKICLPRISVNPRRICKSILYQIGVSYFRITTHGIEE